MAFDVLEHPDAPSFEEMTDYVVEPVAPDVIDTRRSEGEHLVEEDLLDHPDVDAYVELNDPQAPGMTDIGTVLYRLVQLFGTPQFDEYVAGSDISWRSDDTFKYLLRVRKGVDEESLPGEEDDQWLVTVYDSKVRMGVSLAEWHEDPDAGVEVVPEEAVSVLAVVAQTVKEPVKCEYEDKLF